MLTVPDWAGHMAGQHLDVRLTAEDGYAAERSYSIASAPGESLAITVERLDDGEVSPYLTEELRAGDEIEIRGPIGGYFVWTGDESTPLLLVAGGSGVVPFTAKMTIRRDEEFAEMFDQSWRFLHENFYDPKFHGADWNAVRAKYRPLVKHVALREDFYDLINLMLGELNASHLGIGGMPPVPEQVTADLGLIFDESYHGPGLKVAEIVKRGPADKRGLDLKPGDIILSIDNIALNSDVELAKALNDKAGETVVCDVMAGLFSKIRSVELQALPRSKIKTLMYDRWVEANARQVARLSGGKLGYIHIPSMDEAGLEHFVRALYSDNQDKEAIVLDVRYNGGGNTHDQLLNYLGGKEHTLFYQRHGGMGAVLTSSDRKFNKPLVLLINNRSYSDAEILPHAFRTLGLGKLVGQPTGGLVIGTSSYRLIDGSAFRPALS